MRFNLKRTVISALCLTTVLGSVYYATVSAPVPTAKATTVSEYQEYMKELEEQQKELQKEIDKLKGDKSDQNALKSSLNKKIANLQSQIDACDKQISDLDDQIIRLEQENEQKQSQLEETKYTFRQRLRSIYMSGGISSSSLAVLLSADGLEDLLTKSEMTKVISAYDNALMQGILDDMKKIEENKLKVEELIKEQEEAKKTLDSKKEELAADVATVNKTLTGISGDLTELENKMDELDEAYKEYEDAIKKAQDTGSDKTYSGDFAWPCPGYYTVTSPYGYRIHPITHTRKFHKGVDIAGSGIKGKPIVAAADGTVSIASYNTGGYGNYVMINHGTKDGDKYSTLYAHMTRYIVSVGQYVKKGQTIGYVGTTGASTGYHLHFEIRINGETTDPMDYF